MRAILTVHLKSGKTREIVIHNDVAYGPRVMVEFSDWLAVHRHEAEPSGHDDAPQIDHEAGSEHVVIPFESIEFLELR